ncbi:MAG TPA: M28 family peptidase [Longimicrobium sp.]|nr:M28 family peptidase [Longimicrobium sp.]
MSSSPYPHRTVCAIALIALSSGCSAGVPEVARPPEFNQERAWSHHTSQVAFGPRIAGHQPHDIQLRWMEKQLAVTADTVVVQTFTNLAGGRNHLRFGNVWARWKPEATDRVLLVTHWDTPLHAEREPEENKKAYPVPGANEGASGTAVLMELALLLHEKAPQVGVDILLVDGAYYGRAGATEGLGMRHFLANRPAGYKPRWAVYVARVGDRSLEIPMEASTAKAAPAVAKQVWDVAREVGMDSIFVARVGPVQPGDHHLLTAAGIPTVAVIDPEFGRGNELWRTRDDVIANTRMESLGKVGQVLAALVYREAPAK